MDDKPDKADHLTLVYLHMVHFRQRRALPAPTDKIIQQPLLTLSLDRNTSVGRFSTMPDRPSLKPSSRALLRYQTP